ncbi:hypothetical protein N7508_010430 [Penicillium antarcticum]|uniref:uncharacterized protein n=1 Tax=Penicillium antarcticum TaxID=416450 RepID=UPI0023863D75|nr:uncharacterized protein N7508_010430 [Penicillium antarcticum]KAJ5295609.1 hypothetical protein N7508_010430 [Penicillium antarcticum]
MGAAFIICVNSIIKSVLSLLFPSILAKMSATGGNAVVKNRSLLSVSPSTDMPAIKLEHGCPQRYILIRPAKLEPLYKLEGY